MNCDPVGQPPTRLGQQKHGRRPAPFLITMFGHLGQLFIRKNEYQAEGVPFIPLRVPQEELQTPKVYGNMFNNTACQNRPIDRLMKSTREYEAFSDRILSCKNLGRVFVPQKLGGNID